MATDAWTRPSDVLLRDVTEEDLPVFFEHQRDPAAYRMAAFTPRDPDAFAAHWAKILSDDTVITKTILFAGEVVGNVVTFERLGVREVGYWIGREYWGKGIATKALAAFLDHVRTRPLCARVAQHNVASLRVLQKCGFTITGEENGVADVCGTVVDDFILTLRAG